MDLGLRKDIDIVLQPDPVGGRGIVIRKTQRERRDDRLKSDSKVLYTGLTSFQ